METKLTRIAEAARMRPDEIQRITAQINPEILSGKRDYAIIQLGVHSGLRAGDIANLRLIGINWKSNEISLVQGKTQERLVFHLMNQ